MKRYFFKRNSVFGYTEIQNDAWKLRSGGNLRAHIPTAEQKIRDVCGSWKPLPRVLPFAIFMAFIAPVEGILYLEKYIPSLADWSFEANLWLYPAKTAAVIACLVYFWPCYEELKGRGFGIGWKGFAFSIAVGALVYFAWVRMDWSWATIGKAAGYDPFQAGAVAGPVLAGIRLLGAAVVVPIMEELFWRSFLIRYMISSNYESVPLGKFTVGSFLATVLLFGSEHQLWLAGMLAGLAYTLVLYRTKSLWACILAHGVTNLLLGVHVLATGEWRWW